MSQDLSQIKNDRKTRKDLLLRIIENAQSAMVLGDIDGVDAIMRTVNYEIKGILMLDGKVQELLAGDKLKEEVEEAREFEAQIVHVASLLNKFLTTHAEVHNMDSHPGEATSVNNRFSPKEGTTSTEGNQLGREVENDVMEDGISNLTWDQLVKELRLTAFSQVLDAHNEFFLDIVHQWNPTKEELNQIECGRYGGGRPENSYVNYLASTDITIEELCNGLNSCEMDKVCDKLIGILEGKENVEQFSDLLPQYQHQFARYLGENPYNPARRCWRHLAATLDHSTIVPQVESNSIPEAQYSKGYVFLTVLVERSCRLREFKRKLITVLQRIPAVRVIYEAFMGEASYLEMKRNKKAIGEKTTIDMVVKEKDDDDKKLNFLVQLYLTEVGCHVSYEQIEAGSRLSSVLSRAISTVISEKVGFKFYATQANSELDPGSLISNHYGRMKLVFKGLENNRIPVHYAKVNSTETEKLQKQIKKVSKKTCKEAFKEDNSLSFPGWYLHDDNDSLVVKICIAKVSGEQWTDDQLNIMEVKVKDAVMGLSLDIRLDKCILRRDIIYKCDVLFKFTGHLRTYLPIQLVADESLKEKLRKALLDVPLTVGNIKDMRSSRRAMRNQFK